MSSLGSPRTSHSPRTIRVKGARRLAAFIAALCVFAASASFFHTRAYSAGDTSRWPADFVKAAARRASMTGTLAPAPAVSTGAVAGATYGRAMSAPLPLQYRSAGSGDWNVAGTWQTSADGSTWITALTPPTSDDGTITIQNGHTVTVTADVTADELTVKNGGLLLINNGVTFTINDGTGTDLTVEGPSGLVGTAGTITNNGQAQINGVLRIDDGGFPGTTGTYSYDQTTGSLVFNNTTGSYGVNSDHTYWPDTNGPQNVSIGSGGVTMNVARTVGLTCQTSGPITHASNLTFDGLFVIFNFGGSVDSAPTYGNSSTLEYTSSNGPGTYGRASEWLAVTSGAGYPHNVHIGGDTILNIDNAGAFNSAPSQMSGSLTVDSGSALSMGTMTQPLTVLGDASVNGTLTLSTSSGGDLKLGGNWTRDASATFTPNGRAVFFNGSGAQTVTVTGGGTQAFDYLVVDKSGGNLSPAGAGANATNLSVTQTAGNVLQLVNAGGIDLNGQTLTLSGDGGSVLASGGARTVTGTGTFSFTGTKSVTGGGNDSLTFDTGVTVALSKGVDFSSGLTTLKGTLSIKANGFVQTNPPVYSAGSTLEYDNGTSYNAAAEFPASGVQNVRLASTTQLNLNGDKSVAGTFAVNNRTLALGGYKVTTAGANAVTVGDAGSITPASGYVIGTIEKTFAGPGPAAFTFDVGTADGYSPVDASSTTGAGTLAVKSTQGKLAGIAGIFALSRYWTLAGTGVTTNLTFHYLAGDVVGPESNYKIIKYDGANFTQFTPTPLDTSAHSATLNNVSTFSDWTLADPNTISCPTITLSPSLPNGAQDSNYSQTITASGGATPYTFAVTGGALPDGLSLSLDGVLSGSPTATGPFNFTVTATDADGCQGSQAYAVTINPRPASLTVNSTADSADAAPGDGICADANSNCTLRAAIQEADALGNGPDPLSINFNIPAVDPGNGHVYYTDNGQSGVSEANVTATSAADDSSLANPDPDYSDPTHPHSWWRIKPQTPLPPITAQVTINGYSQPGATANTLGLHDGDDALLRIELDGSAIDNNVNPNSRGLDLQSSAEGSLIKGLAVNHFAQADIYLEDDGGDTVSGNFLGTDISGTLADATGASGVTIFSGEFDLVGGDQPADRNVISGHSDTNGTGVDISVSNHTVEGNYIGTDRSGTVALGNKVGVSLHGGGSGNTVGCETTDGDNVISGNTGDGIHVAGSGANIITGNFIGTKADGTHALANGGDGISLYDATDNLVGFLPNDDGANLANTIAFNTGAGVEVKTGGNAAGTGNSIRGNSIHDNGGLGINLVGGTEDANGVTANDPGDSDTGPNNLQNFPVIGPASPGDLSVNGTMDSGTFTIDVYSNTACDPSGNGEGQTHIGAGTANGGAFSVTVPALSSGQFITATATDASGNTSEFSKCVLVNQPPTITPTPVTRQQGTAASNSTIATVSDTETPAGDLSVTATSVPAGITVTNIVNTGGTVTADVSAACDATTGANTVELTVTDGGGASSTANLTVNVTANDAPTLTYPAAQSVIFGDSANVSPTAASDNGSVTYSLQSVSPALATPPTVDPNSGVVSFTNAQPAGDHTITVRATDNCGATTDAPFTITVGAAPTFSIDDVSHNEGDNNTTDFTFTITKSGSTAIDAAVSFDTANGLTNPATGGVACGNAGVDYETQSGSRTFHHDETTMTVTVKVCGDTVVEPDETFVVHLSNPTGATIDKADGLGTIVNDDADYTVTTGATIVVTDDTGNSDTLDISEPSTGFIKFAAPGRVFRINGSTLVTGDSGSLPLSNVSQITVNQGGGDDTANVHAFAYALPSLTINGDAGDDRVNFVGSISFAADANLDVNLQDDSATPGADSVNVSNDAQGAHIVTSGAGTIDVRASKNVTVGSGGSLQTQNGGLTVEANQQASATTGQFDGVVVAGGAIQSTGSGNVSVKGTGGAGDFDNNAGVRVASGGRISTTGAGTLNVSGTGGAFSGATNTGQNNYGVAVADPNSAIVSSSGAVQVTGQGGAGAGANAAGLYGVYLSNSGKIQADGAGTLTISGTGGNVTSGGSGAVNSAGVSMDTGGLIASTGAGANAAAVQITANAGAGGAGSSQGFRLDAPASVTTVDGALTINGTAGTCSLLCLGVSVRGPVSATGSGAVNVNGTGGTGGTGTHGVGVRGNTAGDTGAITSKDGNITVTGTGGDGADNAGINLASTGTGTVQTTGNGSILLVADRMTFDPSNANVNAGPNSVTLRQKTAGTPVDLGSTTDAAAGTLELSDGELDRVAAAALNVGDTDSGAITVSAAITRPAPTAINLTSGGAININASALDSGGGNVTLAPGSSSSVNPAASGTDVSMSRSGTLSFAPGSDLAVAINGAAADTQYTQLNVTGHVDLTGVDLVLSGSDAVAAGQQFVVVSNDGVEAINGNFNGLPEGATIPDFLGSGFDAQISYDGGDGNDCVITVKPRPVFSINNVSLNEGDAGQTHFTFTITKTGDLATLHSTVQVDTADGTASAPSDYTAVTGLVVDFAPGELSKPVTVEVNGDTTYEHDENFFVNLSNPVRATLDPDHTQGTGTIQNDDAKPSISITPAVTQAEGSNNGTTPFVFTVTKTGATDLNAAVSYATADGTATGAIPRVGCGLDADYISQSGTLTFLPNETMKTITVPVCADSTYEANETFFVNLTNQTPDDLTLSNNQGVGTINNDDKPPQTLLVNTTDDNSSGFCLAEHCSLREAITAANANPDANVINFLIPADDPGHFYYANDNNAGQLTRDGSHLFNTSANDDSAIGDIDPDWPHSWWTISPQTPLPPITSAVTINGYTQPGASANTSASADNAVLRVEINGAGAGVSTNGLTLGGGGSTLEGLIVNRFGGHGVNVASGNDTVAGNFVGTDASGTLALANGGSGLSSSNEFSNIFGGATADARNVVSGNTGDGITLAGCNSTSLLGNFIGTKADGSGALGNGGNGVAFSTGSVFNTVGGVNAGEANTIAFNGGDGVQVDSTSGPGHSVRGNSIHNNGANANNLGIDLGPDGVTANDDKDADSGPNGLQNFPVITSVLVTGSTKTITGTLNSKPNQTFVIDFYSNTSCDTPGGNGEGQTYLGSLTTAPTDSVSGDVSFTFHPTALALGQVVTATATATDPGVFGSTSEFSACASATTGDAGTIQFKQSNYTVAENGGVAHITVQRVGGNAGIISATFSTSDGTATVADNDYQPVAGTTVTFNDGDTADKTVDVTVNDDTVYEAAETVNLSLSSTSINRPLTQNGPLDPVAGTSATLTITNDDTPPTLSIGDFTENEGDNGTTSFTFTVTRSGNSTEVAASANYATQDGSAIAPGDYQSASGTVTIPANQTTATVTVLVNGDTTQEPDETFTVHLSSPTDATIAGADGTGTIKNDDGAPTFSVNSQTHAEGNGGTTDFTFTVTKTGATAFDTSVNYATADGTATTADADYQSASGTLTFGPSETTKTFTVHVNGDTKPELDETFNVSLSHPLGATIPNGQGTATGTIQNDDESASAGQLIISEFRLRGPGATPTPGPTPGAPVQSDGPAASVIRKQAAVSSAAVDTSPQANDEFVELYNNTDSPLLVTTTDGSKGWAVAASDGVVRFVVPNGTSIPARGHFLGVNKLGYSLAAYPAGNDGANLTMAAGDPILLGDGTPDTGYTRDIPDNAGIAVFRTADAAHLNTTTRLDSAGSTSETNTLYKEGAGYPALSPTDIAQNLNYSFYRNLCDVQPNSTCASNNPKDTGDNAADFLFVDTKGTLTAAGQRLGAPGPENLSSYIQRNALIPGAMLDSSKSSTLPPNRFRDPTPNTPSASVATFGTLSVRRRYTNNTGSPVTQLRFRIVELTTFPAPAGTADLRAISSARVSVSNVGDADTCGGATPCTVTVEGTTVEEPPAQLSATNGANDGGGYNTSLGVGAIRLAHPLAPGASVNVQLMFGVRQTGNFHFLVIVEAKQ